MHTKFSCVCRYLYIPRDYLLSGDYYDGWTYEYNDAGQITTIKGRNNLNNGDAPWYERNVAMLRTLTYDSNGNVVEETESQYRDNRLLVQDKKIMEYTFNGGSVPVSGSYTHQFYSDTYGTDGYESYLRSQTKDEISYTYDQQGRLVTKTIIYGKTFIYDVGNPNDAISEDQPIQQKKSYDIIYGDYYIYNPAK